MTAVDVKRDVAMEPMKDGKPAYASEPEYEYKSIVWSDFFTKAKYIPWWILGGVVGILVLLLTLNHDLIVEVRNTQRLVESRKVLIVFRP